MRYKLLTPGPLTTTDTVKREMLFDHCTWDEDYKNITQNIRNELVDIAHCSRNRYTAVLMQGSGTFGVEAVLSSVIGKNDKLLILANGAYGQRMAEIARAQGINHIVECFGYSNVPNAKRVEEILDSDDKITHVSMVHCETTSGILNDIAEIANVLKGRNITLIVDAMSSFGGVDIDVEGLGIDFIISSANKCIQGVPGFSFIIANIEKLKNSKGSARSLSLDLYAQWECMEKDGKWRFTSPTHTVLAFAEALNELRAEGGVLRRYERYYQNNRLLINKLRDLDIQTYIDIEYQSPIITTFIMPTGYDFDDMYSYIKLRGYAIYPGKVTDANTFRIGNIGEIYKEDIIKVCDIIESYLRRK